MKVDKITPQIAALYLGQKWEVSKQPIFWDRDDLSTIPATITGTVVSYLGLYSAFEITPHLRRLESITEEEAIHIHDLVIGFPYAGIIPCKEWICLAWSGESSFYQDAIGYPAAWLYLLSKGFDLFGLIDSGLAKEIPV